MYREPLVSPAATSTGAELVDWLELQAFFSPGSVARLDVAVSALEMQIEDLSDEIDAADEFKDKIVSKIEREFEFRAKDVGDHYPFKLSDDAEEFFFVGDMADPNDAFYLVCLLASHLVKSPFLTFSAPEDDVQKLISALRNRVFQIVSTIALSGLAEGPAVSIGWPRVGDETILEALARAQQYNAGIVARKEANPEVENPRDKDGGMDVIAWRSCNRPPPTNFYFGQVASGRDWTEKAASSKVNSFKTKFLDTPPLSNEDYATLTPYRIDDDRLYKRQHADHYTILDRTTVPKHARRGLELATNGEPVDEADALECMFEWIGAYRRAVNP